MDRHPIGLVEPPPCYEGSTQRPRSACMGTVEDNRQDPVLLREPVMDIVSARRFRPSADVRRSVAL